MSSADKICKQFGPRSGSELFDPERIFLKKLILKKNQQTTKKRAKLPSRQRVKLLEQYLVWLSVYLLPNVEVILY